MTYAVAYIVNNAVMIYLSRMFYDTAHAYYLPQQKLPDIVVEVPEEEPEEEVCKTVLR